MGSDFLGIANKTFVVFGAANRRSIAVAVARTLQEAGARVIHVVQNAEIAGQVQALFGDTPVLTCDVRDEKAIAEVATQVGAILKDSCRLNKPRAKISSRPWMCPAIH
jgi:enoyl-[acyl-carrier protein] reductase I